MTDKADKYPDLSPLLGLIVMTVLKLMINFKLEIQDGYHMYSGTLLNKVKKLN
jgi:hypothetical protein